MSHMRINLPLGVEDRQRTRKPMMENSVPCLVSKGFPGLATCSCNFIRVVAIDYINCVLLGIFKMHLTLWFDKTHWNEPFSIAPKMSEVDKCFHAIKPPRLITRFPRSLIEMEHFKSSELKNFRLVLQSAMPGWSSS